MSGSNGVSSRGTIDWLGHLRACESGQRLADYARAHGLRVKSFYNARTHLLRRGLVQSNVSTPLFQRARVVSAPALVNCRVHLANGVTVEFGVEVSGLGEVLQAVRAL